MVSRGWFSRRTPLQIALEQDVHSGADLGSELQKLCDYKIESRVDAEAICAALEPLVTAVPKEINNQSLHSLVGLFLQVESRECPAFAVLEERGIGLLVEIVNRALQNPSLYSTGDVLFAIRILASYGTGSGTDAVIRAARQPLQPDSYNWNVILSEYSGGHPECERLFKTLSDPLPDGFLAVSLLDGANAARLNGAEFPHPFDSVAGRQQLERWLTGDDEEYFSYAVSAAAAIPFVGTPARNDLLAIAFEHPCSDVQLEAAWGSGRLGSEAGIKWLSRACLDLNLADRARQYLSQLNRTDAIPPEAEEAGFRARAEFTQWLAHPSELGRAPDELEILDHRELKWPPEFNPIPMWLIKYRNWDATGLADDDIGVGLVGSMTFCLFSYDMEQRPPEDCYAIHCYWEMSNCKLITERRLAKNSTGYNRLQQQYQEKGFDQVQIVCIAELSEELKYPRKFVALGKATRKGRPGWCVLDGPRSRWYAAANMPAETSSKTVLMIHIGRVLLGFGTKCDRRKFLQPAEPQMTPEQFIAAYEQLLHQAHTDSRQTRNLLGRGNSILGTAFSDYVSALSVTRSQSEVAETCRTYETLLSIASEMAPEVQSDLYDVFSPLGEVFDRYVDALVELNRQADVPALLEKFQPYWNHNTGYIKLGGAAFRSGHDQIAEPWILKFRHSLKDWYRHEEIGFLAEIWKKQGRTEDAHALLIEALKGLHKQGRKTSGNDRKLFEKTFQKHRCTYRKLFPERGDGELQRLGIGLSILTESKD